MIVNGSQSAGDVVNTGDSGAFQIDVNTFEAILFDDLDQGSSKGLCSSLAVDFDTAFGAADGDNDVLALGLQGLNVLDELCLGVAANSVSQILIQLEGDLTGGGGIAGEGNTDHVVVGRNIAQLQVGGTVAEVVPVASNHVLRNCSAADFNGALGLGYGRLGHDGIGDLGLGGTAGNQISAQLPQGGSAVGQPTAVAGVSVDALINLAIVGNQIAQLICSAGCPCLVGTGCGRIGYRRLGYGRIGYGRIGYGRLGYRRLGNRRLGNRRLNGAAGDQLPGAPLGCTGNVALGPPLGFPDAAVVGNLGAAGVSSGGVPCGDSGGLGYGRLGCGRLGYRRLSNRRLGHGRIGCRRIGCGRIGYGRIGGNIAGSGAVDDLRLGLGQAGQNPLGHGDADDVGDISSAGNIHGEGVAGAGLHGLGSVDAGQVNDTVTILVGNAAGLAACGESSAAGGLDVQLGEGNGFLEQLGVLQGNIGALIDGLVVLQGEGVGAAGCGDGQAHAGVGSDDFLCGQRSAAVQGFLHGSGQAIGCVQGGHPADQAAQAVLLDVCALGCDGAGVVAGEEVAGGGAVVVSSLCSLVVVLLQLVLGDQHGQIGLAEGAGHDTVGCLNRVGLCGGKQAGVSGVTAVILNAGPAAGIRSNTDDDLGVVDLVAVGILQVLNTGIDGEDAVGLGCGIIVGVHIQAGLVAGVGSPCAAQVVGHHVGEVNDFHDLVVLDHSHHGGRSGHSAGQLVVLAVLCAQSVQLVTDGLHQQGEVDLVFGTALAALVDGNTVALGIGITVSTGVLPVDIDEVIAQVVNELGNVACEVLTGGSIGCHGGEVTGAGPAADGNTNLHIGVLLSQDGQCAQNAGIGLTIGDAALLGQDCQEVCVLVAQDQIALLIHIQESEVQVCNVAAVDVAGIEILLTSIDRPLAIVHDITVGGLSGCCLCHVALSGDQDKVRAQNQCEKNRENSTQCGSLFHGDTPFAHFGKGKIPFSSQYVNPTVAFLQAL